MTCKSTEQQGLVVKMDCLCTSERDSSCSCGCIFTENRGGHSVARQQTFHLKCITEVTLKERTTAPSKSTIRSGVIGRKKKTWSAPMTRNTNVLRLFLMVRAHPEILQFVFWPIYHYSLWQTQCHLFPKELYDSAAEDKQFTGTLPH